MSGGTWKESDPDAAYIPPQGTTRKLLEDLLVEGEVKSALIIKGGWPLTKRECDWLAAMPHWQDGEGEHAGGMQIAAKIAALTLRAERAEKRVAELAHETRRMLQALDAYWLTYDGQGPEKFRHPHGDDLMEHWWFKFERYRKRVESLLAYRGQA